MANEPLPPASPSPIRLPQRRRPIGRAALAGLSLFLLQSSGCALLVGGAAAGAVGGGVKSAQAGEQEHHSPMTYVGTVLANAVYFPAKVIFAGGGAITSGLVYIATLGDEEATGSVWNASTKGDYLLSPRMIEGREDVRFVG